MGLLASMRFPPALIFIMCGQLVLQTNATFFIEVYDRNNGMSLYECNVPNAVVLPIEYSAVALPPSYTTNQDISCALVVDITRKQEAYKTANFYLVVNPRLHSGRRITLGSRSAELPPTVFVGVRTVGDEAADYPAFVRDLGESHRMRLRTKCLGALPARFLESDMNFEAFVGYMGTADFRQLALPVGPASVARNIASRFTAFGEVVRRVEFLHMSMVVHARRDRVTMEEQTRVRGQVKSAIGLLIQKMIDPCFVMTYFRDTGLPAYREGIPTTPLEVAHSSCKNHCLLLRTTSLLYPNAPPCGYTLWDGACEGRVCVCEKKPKMFTCVTGPSKVIFIKCSNDIKISLAGSVNMGL